MDPLNCFPDKVWNKLVDRAVAMLSMGMSESDATMKLALDVNTLHAWLATKAGVTLIKLRG